MRWLTLVLSVTLFHSLSFVYAIPHDAENHHWLHKRQGLTSSSPSVSSPVVSPSHSPQVESTSLVSPTRSLDVQEPSSPPSSSSSIQTQPSPTSEPSPEPSSTISSSSSSISPPPSSSSQSSSSTRSTTSSPPSPTTTNGLDTQSRTRRFSSTVGTTVSANGNTRTGTGSGNSFLKNKAAVGSTFAIVGIVGVAMIIGIVFFLIKKARKRRDQDELDTYFEKLPGNNGNSVSNRNVGGNDYGHSPTTANLTSPAHDQAYMSRDVHYGVDQYPNPFANYNGFEYPPDRGSVVERPASVSYAPGTAYAAAMSQRGQYNYQGQVEDPNAVPNHPFADPDNRHY